MSPYAVLGLPEDASPAAVKAAYRRLTVELHPDRNPGDDQAADRFRRVREAYEQITAPKPPPAAPPPPARPGADLGVDVSLPLLVALRGGDHHALVDRSPQPPLRVAFTVPRGCRPGEVVRLRGLGRPGTPPGDLVVRIGELQPDARWQLVGVDLVGRLAATLGEVYAGASLVVEDAPWGPLRVPLRPRSLDPIRVRGHGWRGQGRAGDLVLELDVRWPQPDPMLEALLRHARY